MSPPSSSRLLLSATAAVVLWVALLPCAGQRRLSYQRRYRQSLNIGEEMLYSNLLKA